MVFPGRLLESETAYGPFRRCTSPPKPRDTTRPTSFSLLPASRVPTPLPWGTPTYAIILPPTNEPNSSLGSVTITCTWHCRAASLLRTDTLSASACSRASDSCARSAVVGRSCVDESLPGSTPPSPRDSPGVHPARWGRGSRYPDREAEMGAETDRGEVRLSSTRSVCERPPLDTRSDSLHGSRPPEILRE